MCIMIRHVIKKQRKTEPSQRIKRDTRFLRAEMDTGPIPPMGEWRTAPYLRTAESQILARGGVDPTDTLLLAPEATLEDAELLTLASILRLRIERGDLLYSETHYGAFCNSPADWPEWVDDVLNTPAYREIVVRSLTLEVVSACRDLSLPRNNRAIQDIGFVISC